VTAAAWRRSRPHVLTSLKPRCRRSRAYRAIKIRRTKKPIFVVAGADIAIFLIIYSEGAPRVIR
jgi:hypothetical protein